MVGSAGKPMQLFLDNDGKIINRNKIEYGVYNKIIDLEFKKVLFIKKHYIGLGDIIDWITRLTRIKDLIIYLTKGNCGCEARRVKFNKWFKFYWFSIKFREIYADDYNIIPKHKKLIQNIVPVQEPPKERQQEHRKVTVIEKPVTEAQVKKSCNCGARR
jgi:hypothetical protein